MVHSPTPQGRVLAFVLAGVAGVCEVLLVWNEVAELSRRFDLNPGPYFHLVIALLGLGVLVGAALLAARRPRVARVLMLGAVAQVVLAVPGSMLLLGIRRSSAFEDVFLPAGLAAVIAVLLWLPAVAVALPEVMPRFAGGPGWQPGYGGPAGWQGAGMPGAVPGQQWQGVPGMAGPVPGQQWPGAGGAGQAWQGAVPGQIPGAAMSGLALGQQWPAAVDPGQAWQGGAVPGQVPGQAMPGSVPGQQWPGAGGAGQAWQGSAVPGQNPGQPMPGSVPAQQWPGAGEPGQAWQAGAAPPGPASQGSVAPAQAWSGAVPAHGQPGQPWPGSMPPGQPMPGSDAPGAPQQQYPPAGPYPPAPH
ncbi:hypothetical protein [Amycolatopsis sp. NPDC050768]|uniref:hypothetical protein n=1 Tax=Amycolatopsis sp. NPDC050768 TaxID=3154839 RepID=UPI0033D8636A